MRRRCDDCSEHVEMTYHCGGRKRRLHLLPSGRVLAPDRHTPGERALMAIRGEPCDCRARMSQLVEAMRWGSALLGLPTDTMSTGRLRVAARRALGHGLREHGAVLALSDDHGLNDFQRGVHAALASLPRPRGRIDRCGWDAVVMICRTQGVAPRKFHVGALWVRLLAAFDQCLGARPMSEYGWKVAQANIIPDPPSPVQLAQLHYVFEGQEACVGYQAYRGPGMLLVIQENAPDGRPALNCRFVPGAPHRLSLGAWHALAAQAHPSLVLTLQHP
jgi:hypothetical protein